MCTPHLFRLLMLSGLLTVVDALYLSCTTRKSCQNAGGWISGTQAAIMQACTDAGSSCVAFDYDTVNNNRGRTCSTTSTANDANSKVCLKTCTDDSQPLQLIQNWNCDNARCCGLELSVCWCSKITQYQHRSLQRFVHHGYNSWRHSKSGIIFNEFWGYKPTRLQGIFPWLALIV